MGKMLTVRSRPAPRRTPPVPTERAGRTQATELHTPATRGIQEHHLSVEVRLHAHMHARTIAPTTSDSYSTVQRSCIETNLDLALAMRALYMSDCVKSAISKVIVQLGVLHHFTSQCASVISVATCACADALAARKSTLNSSTCASKVSRSRVARAEAPSDSARTGHRESPKGPPLLHLYASCRCSRAARARLHGSAACS